MVSRFRRTLSFPTKPTPNPSRPSPPQEKSYHVRSISLPCRSHPLISQLQTEIQDLRTSSARTCDGLVMLKSLHDSVDDLLQLPQTQESLRRRPDWAERLLDHFLLFADVFGILRAALMALREEQLGVQVGVRRRNEATAMAAYVKARKKMDKEVKRVVSEVRNLGRRPVPDGSLLVLVDGNAELAMILRDVHDVTVSSSISILNGIVNASTGFSFDCCSWILWKKKKKKKKKIGIDFRGFEEVERMCGLLRKRGGEEGVLRRSVLGKLEEMEKCIGEMESGSEGVFRSFLRARVSLLNILSQ